MRTRLFLRTAEFLWQEGHTAHAAQKEADEEAFRMMDVYRRFAEDWMAMPVLAGKKSEGQKFAGAVYTLCIEAMMQDKKALQAGTSHMLGQNFAKAFDVKFQNKEGRLETPYATSWGVSTRLIGGMVMTHGDDAGLVLPPRLAPVHVAIVPVYRKEEERAACVAAANTLAAQVRALPLRDWLGDGPATVKVDDRDQFQPGYKFAEWEAKGVPVRVEIGPRDIAANACVVARRDVPGKEGKTFGVPLAGAAEKIGALLREIQSALLNRARKFRDENTFVCDSYDEFKAKIENPGGFFLCHWDGTRPTEDRVAAETKATIRCIPLDDKVEAGKCMVTGAPSQRRVVFGRAY
jgi:prolyl-tRNA synthetase